MRVIIMAGGLGTRISSVASDIPKPMIDICGKPVLERQLACLRRQGFTHVTLVVGHLKNIICDYFGDGSRFQMKIDYISEEEPLGTAGALFYLKDQITDSFLLLNGDILFDVDFRRMLNYHKQKQALATLLTHPNEHPRDSVLLETDKEGRITNWMLRGEPREDYHNRVNAGIHILEPQVLDMIQSLEKMDLDKHILKPLVAGGRAFSYASPEYVKDMGTPERYAKVCGDFQGEKVALKNLLRPQKAFFLDRDGTINALDEFITKPDQIRLLPSVAEAIKRINQSEYLAIVVTNQPVIARGDCTFEELDNIHKRMERLLGEGGAYIDDLFFCPHHPDKGFAGERVEYKISCNCRKPNSGLLLQAAKKYNIDLTGSIMIGDSHSDMKAGQAVGCRCFYLGDSDDETVTCSHFLLEAVNLAIKNREL